MNLYLHKCGCVSRRPRRSTSTPTIVKFIRMFSCTNAEYVYEEGFTPASIFEANVLPPKQSEIFLDGYNAQLRKVS